MDITFKNLQKKVPISPSRGLNIVKSILCHEGVDKAVLSIVFVTRQRITALNKKYLRRDYATDVLVFDLNDNRRGGRAHLPACRSAGAPTCGTGTRREPKTITGEIIISTDAVSKNAKAYEKTLAEELTLYIIHGILHLLGFDDHKPQDIQQIRGKEQEILNILGTEVRNIIR